MLQICHFVFTDRSNECWELDMYIDIYDKKYFGLVTKLLQVYI